MPKASHRPPHLVSAKEAASKWNELTDKQQKRAIRRHINGTCICYVPMGTGINGTMEAPDGRSCTFACMNGNAQKIARGRHHL